MADNNANTGDSLDYLLNKCDVTSLQSIGGAAGFADCEATEYHKFTVATLETLHRSAEAQHPHRKFNRQTASQQQIAAVMQLDEQARTSAFHRGRNAHMKDETKLGRHVRATRVAEAADTTAEKIEAYYDAPASLLKRHGMYDQRRANLQTVLNGAGAHELRAHLQHALQTNDAIAAAAVVAALDRLPKDARDNFVKITGESINSIAERFMGKTCNDARQQAKRLRLAADFLRKARHAFMSGNPMSTRHKIERGLAQAELAAARKASGGN